MHYDPKLKEAAAEIEEILKRRDIIGSMILVSSTHSEYLFRVEASWTVMRLEPVAHGVGIRFRSKREDFPSKEKQHEATEASVHALTSILQFGRMCQDKMQFVLEKLKGHMTLAYRVWD